MNKEKPMRKLNIQIEPGEQPPSAAIVEAARESLQKLRLTVSGLSTTFLGLLLVAFLAVKFDLAPLPIKVAEVVFFISIVGYVLSYKYETGPLARRIAEVSPIPDSLLTEAALLSEGLPAAKEYRDALREQKRDLTLAEFEALKRLAAASPVAAARTRLYG
jgi:hypothetical protein